jgi:hypothetical protein
VAMNKDNAFHIYINLHARSLLHREECACNHICAPKYPNESR